ncbi:putative quinol monooxygenase [Roseobacter sp. HKCCA0434]|uniref:putative quinol monooxygenase n=1 Tax=Roseobacter sp. HKCCA0434 TaxID=3079297 RepID=UPI002905CFAF|nr:putative quinol monooxygenase [Roseobacter sp. HKCCA0434]
MTDLTVFARIEPKPEHYHEALTAIRGIVDATRTEPGCRRFEVNAGQPGDPALYLVEWWRSDAALDAHYAQDYTRAVFAAYEGWLARPVEVTKMRPA